MSPATVYVIGAGVDPVRHLTIEAIQLLGACKEIWTNVPIDVFRRLPGNLAPAVRSLKPFYRDNRPRRQNYADVTRHILARAGELGRPGRELKALRITLSESHLARAQYEAPLW